MSWARRLRICRATALAVLVRLKATAACPAGAVPDLAEAGLLWHLSGGYCARGRDLPASIQVGCQ